ncbi:MAG: hypothetical protein K1X75_05025 [Leptospirales bacterium]|nr:hypothetical protein [Leptospirales bacterium]
MASAALLGVALAYLGTTLVRFFLVSASSLAAEAPPGARLPAPVFATRPLEEYASIPTGAFFRDSGAAAPTPGEGGPSGGGEITLVGTLAGSADFARALIQETGQSDPQSYGLGKTVAGFRIVGIGSDYVLVESGGARLKIKVGEKSGQAQAQQPAPGPAASGGNVQRIVVQRSKLNEIMQDPRALGQAGMRPFQRGGRTMGLQLVLVPPNSLLYQLGARSGDIIRRFNGQSLESNEKMLEVVNALRSSSQVTVDLERGGQVMTFDISIQ